MDQDELKEIANRITYTLNGVPLTDDEKENLQGFMDALNSFIDISREFEHLSKPYIKVNLAMALNDLGETVKVIDGIIEDHHSEDSDLFLNMCGFKGNSFPSLEEVNTFLENLTPSKVKSILPKKEMTLQEKEALRFTKEEIAARRSGSPEKLQETNEARRDRAKAFLATLTIGEFFRMMSHVNGEHYSTNKPVPVIESKDYGVISTTRFYAGLSEIIFQEDPDEAAEHINRRKKRNVAESGQIEQEKNYVVLQIKERGGGTRIAVAEDFELESISENGQKEFDYVLSQIYKQCYDTDQDTITPSIITISDDDLIKYRVCGTENKKVVQRNFKQFIFFLSDLRAAALTASVKRKKKGIPEKTIEQINLTPLFKRSTYKRGGSYELVPNEEFNWKAALQYYNPLPMSAFTLSKRAYRTLSIILQKARLTASDRKKTTEINFRLAELTEVLNLPVDTDKTKQLIKDPIRAIIDEINDTVSDISLSLEADEEANKAEYLRGNIKVTFNGELLQTFEKLQQQRKENKLIAQERKHRRAVKALEQKKTKTETDGNKD